MQHKRFAVDSAGVPSVTITGGAVNRHEGVLRRTAPVWRSDLDVLPG